MTEIIFPWPPSALSPNSRKHWTVRHRARKKYKSDCFYLSRSQQTPDIEGLCGIPVCIVFHPPSRRRADLDNMLASFKAGIDPLALAWGVDDSLFTLTISKGPPVKNGCVKVTVPA